MLSEMSQEQKDKCYIYVSRYMRYLNQSNSQTQEQNSGSQGPWEQEQGELLINGHKSLIKQDE